MVLPDTTSDISSTKISGDSLFVCFILQQTHNAIIIYQLMHTDVCVFQLEN